MRVVLFCEQKYAISILRPIADQAKKEGVHEVLWYVHRKNIVDFPFADEVRWTTDIHEIIRIMPNTPCSIGFGVSAITSLDASTESIEFIDKIFKTISSTVFVEEKYFDAVTSISGSGPAYVYYFIKSMIDAGVDGGLSFEQSKMLTLQTFIGASKMVEKSDEDLAVLINKVCSKGGTTIQAIDTFNNNNLDKIILDGIQKCRKRSEELSK